MATVKRVSQLRQSDISTVPRHGVVALFGYNVRIFVEGGHLILLDGVETERRFRLARVAHGLRRLVVVDTHGYLSLSALRWLSDQNVGFALLERTGKVLAITAPPRPSDVRLKRSQALAHSSGAALRISRELIRQKLTGQQQTARFKLHDSHTADEISRFSAELPSTDSIASIRLIEAQAASAYWSAWRSLPINFPRNDLRRVPDRWCSFGARISPLTGSPRLAVNPPNSILNYLYAVLETEARLATAAIGLDPGLGVLHADQPGRDSLALDILEPVRAHVDSYLIDFLSQPLRREWFFEERNGNARLMNSLAARLSETAPMWGRAVAPVAEWVAQALWNSAPSKYTDASVPTRLTQRRRIEGRGNEFAPRRSVVPKQIRVCEVCGTEGVQNRYCRSCAVEISRENMAQVALIGHAKPRTPREKARVSKVLSDHAVAISWWSPSSQPAWLNEECYVQKIQPKLRTIRVREIAKALKVSQPYAAFIRSGRRRPHPRHWQALAGLAGVSTDSSSRTTDS
jgi:CRISPR-associated endonuclease Cas1